MNVEYLVLIDDNDQYCQSIDALNNLIKGCDDIKIEEKKVLFENCSFGYEVSLNYVAGSSQRNFHLTLTLLKDDEQEKFNELLKLLRTILSKMSGRPPEVLWDDLSSQLCEKAYPVIHKTENLLRKLIAKIMLANLGVKWTQVAIPSEVDNSIKGQASDRSDVQKKSPKKTNDTGNYLYQLDFIQLSKLLFKEYSTGNIEQIKKNIAKAASVDNLDIEELKELIPKSNWQRYFSPIIECQSSFLEKNGLVYMS